MKTKTTHAGYKQKNWNEERNTDQIVEGFVEKIWMRQPFDAKAVEPIHKKANAKQRIAKIAKRHDSMATRNVKRKQENTNHTSQHKHDN